MKITCAILKNYHSRPGCSVVEKKVLSLRIISSLTFFKQTNTLIN